VAKFAELGRVEDSVDFGRGKRLSFSIETSALAAEPHALYESGAIKVMVPPAAAKEWTDTDRVGIEGAPTAGPGVLIEKDFQCLHREDMEADAYPNPLAGGSD